MLNIVEMKTIEDVRQESEMLSDEIEKLYNQNITWF